MPADETAARAHYQCTRAVTIKSPVEGGWPWLIQVARLRGGFYADDLLDNLGHPSARTILPTCRVSRWASGSPYAHPPRRSPPSEWPDWRRTVGCCGSNR